ncbi:hypothetical protein [Mesorhizobium captivum]|uniref:Uncharacterized protein n=1 Tax=Mesorhizobium captivum TaxID=3072319 RepID=A0ABU4YV84_9HYPH|nr:MULTISPECIES: hypothetical protein [unclassified Mesorhizobium]MDX8446874.1 hypothetical protein [Mesorhizobium sp. VK3C]MDX8490874.1 hypothetical protein [Mesorhizobium sp. VK22B]MDX8498856.1 hypothetical protein [Mesorhizobium sp. VK4C]MDX8504038.1 hypothetical protein [Mesorhizobium sp. VK22E]
MDPRNKKRSAKQGETEAPAIAQQDWEALEGNKVLPDSVVVENGVPDTQETEGTLPEEDDDNPYEESDEALPDDEEEDVLKRDPSKEGSRFDEV